MRNTLLIIIFVSFSTARAQEYQTVEQTSQQLHDIYAKKRTTNIIAGWSMVGAGIGMALAGYGSNMSGGIIDNDTTNNSKGIWLVYVGGATTLASVPFFIGANKNKRKARLELKKEMVLINEPTNYPSISLSLNF